MNKVRTMNWGNLGDVVESYYHIHIVLRGVFWAALVSIITPVRVYRNLVYE